MRHCRWWWGMAASLAVCSTSFAQLGSRARYAQVEEPRWLRLQISNVELGVWSEGTYEQTSYKNSGQSTTSEYFFIGPSLSLNMAGSVYHPNLIQFMLYGEGAYGWQDQITRSGGSSSTVQGMQAYGNFSANAQILPNKPLSGSLAAGYGRSFQEYDFFTRTVVESLNYGGQINYGNPWIALFSTYAHNDANYLNLTSPYNSHQDTVNVNARNQHFTGTTTLNYTYTKYNSASTNFLFDTTNQNLSLADSETFGLQKQISVGAGVSGNHLEAGPTPEDSLAAFGSLDVEHNRSLNSHYYINYDQLTVGDFNVDTLAGSAYLQHYLYESLTSTVNFNISSSDSVSGLNTGYNRQLGGGLTEVYTKQLGPDHRLHVDASVFINHIDQQATGRAVNEPHTFPRPPLLEEFYLNQPNVEEATIVIAPPGGLLQPYVRGLDYEVFHSGSLTGIRRIIGGTIPEGATVSADYSAEPRPPASYDMYNENLGVRLDLWRNLWGLYGRVTFSENDAPATFHVPTLTTYIVGSDVKWHWLTAGAEYQNFNSTDSVYWSVRLFQTGTWTLDDRSFLNVGFTEAYIAYQNTELREQNYRFMTRYNRLLLTNLRCGVLGGIGIIRGEGVDQTAAVVRPDLTYNFGKTSIQFTYDFQYNLYLSNEERLQNIFMLRIRRDF